MKMFIQADGPSTIKVLGTAMMKKPNPVYLLEQDDPFHVQTEEDVLGGKAGDFVAYDPISGHVWPVAASCVKQHYEPHTVRPSNPTALAARLTNLLFDFRYESTTGRGARGLMVHHVEALLKDLVPFITKEIEKTTREALDSFTHEQHYRDGLERKALSDHWHGQRKAA